MFDYKILYEKMKLMFTNYKNIDALLKEIFLETIFDSQKALLFLSLIGKIEELEARIKELEELP